MLEQEQYRANIATLQPLVSRNAENIENIIAPSFWLNDVEQVDGSHQIKVETTSQKAWLKFNQAQGNLCTLFPVDGNEGVFIYPPPIKNIADFLLPNGKHAGGCDFLLINHKWLFGELKTEATSQNPEQIQENRTKAAMQLARTLTYFKENTVNGVINAKNATCMIITPSFFPKIAKIPMALTVKFLKTYNVRLTESTADETIKL
jgi:hypothetical protein